MRSKGIHFRRSPGRLRTWELSVFMEGSNMWDYKQGSWVNTYGTVQLLTHSFAHLPLLPRHCHTYRYGTGGSCFRRAGLHAAEGEGQPQEGRQEGSTPRLTADFPLILATWQFPPSTAWSTNLDVLFDPSPSYT